MTEDEVIQLLEQADPVRRIEPGPSVDAVGYLDALRTRGTTVTLTHTGPTAKPGLGHRRRWPIITVAAAVVAVVVAGLALVARDETSDTHIPAAPSATAPATTTTATPAEVAAAEETARGFIDAENAYDVDRMVTYLDAEPENLDEFRLQMAWHQAVGSKKLNVHCAITGRVRRRHRHLLHVRLPLVAVRRDRVRALRRLQRVHHPRRQDRPRRVGHH